MSICPALGGINPARMFKSVDFPQPLGPTIDTNRRAGTSKLIPSMATNAPKLLAIFRTVIAGKVHPGIDPASFSREEFVCVELRDIELIQPFI